MAKKGTIDLEILEITSSVKDCDQNNLRSDNFKLTQVLDNKKKTSGQLNLNFNMEISSKQKKIIEKKYWYRFTVSYMYNFVHVQHSYITSTYSRA